MLVTLMHNRSDDVEAIASRDEENNSYEAETEALLPSSRPVQESFGQLPDKNSCSQKRFGLFHIAGAFLLGAVACVVTQYAFCGTDCFRHSSADRSVSSQDGRVSALAPPYVGSTEVHQFPPSKPTNAFPSLFPTHVGYAGGTPTGAEPAVIATAPVYPVHPGQCPQQLIGPEAMPGQKPKDSDVEDDAKEGKHDRHKFNLFKSWGNLSPWFSVGRNTFGIDSSPEAPDTCVITGLHFLHRHGARYPTAWSRYGGPAKFSQKLHKSAEKWNASATLDFLNTWTYKLGEELLTPFGRQQLFDLGTSIRMKYGYLLQNFTATNTIPVFRTESQDRMLASALNFAIGFFGYPFEGQYQQLITIEHAGFNNTLAPYKTCPNANTDPKSERGVWYTEQWADIYLTTAKKRLQKDLHGLELSTEDVYIMQQLCSYETVALGYSKFCELFTEEEWEGFNYALDLQFWYNSAFGSPVARIQGIGYVQELVARLTHTPIPVHNTSTNATINDNSILFPLGQSLYVDATHEVVVLNIITALNLTSFAAGGPLPYTHIPHDRTFRVAELAPFATNIQFQLLDCSSIPTGPQIRVVINDGVAPLTGIKGCPEQKDGMCPIETFVKAQKEIIADSDWIWECHGDWDVPPGPEWETTTGRPPPRRSTKV